jgi:hypothetical protein
VFECDICATPYYEEDNVTVYECSDVENSVVS